MIFFQMWNDDECEESSPLKLIWNSTWTYTASDNLIPIIQMLEIRGTGLWFTQIPQPTQPPQKKISSLRSLPGFKDTTIQ